MQEISGIINANKRAFIIQVLGSLKSVFWDKSRSCGYIDVIVLRQNVAFLGMEGEKELRPCHGKAHGGYAKM
jgi:hypothetical protein